MLLKYLIKGILYATDAELISCLCIATKKALNLGERMRLNERCSHSSSGCFEIPFGSRYVTCGTVEGEEVRYSIQVSALTSYQLLLNL